MKVTQLSSVQAHNSCRVCVCNAFIYEQLRSTAKNFAFSPGKPLPVREPPTLLASSLDGTDEGEEGEADLDSLEG